MPRVRLDSLDVDEPIPNAWEAIANTVRGELEDRGAARSERARARRSIRDWVDLVPEERGPLDLAKYAFQIEPLYSDRAVTDREQVHLKATQIGWSTGAIRQALYHADVLGRSVLYTFPTEAELSAFSQKRIRPVIRGSEHLRSRMAADAIDNVFQKHIGEGWIDFRGLNKPVDSVDVDVLIIDEYDTSNQANINATEYRLSGAESADLRRRIGVPSIPGFGIDSFYEASDQRAWSVRCEACNHWNRLVGLEAFTDNVDQDQAALVCSKCRRIIDVRAGEWVPAYPDRDVRGYHAPKFLVPGRRVLERVIANSKKTRPDQVEDFHRRDLGQAWAAAEGRLSLEAVRACVRPELRLEETLLTYKLVTMGIDVASARDLNFVIEESLTDDYMVGRRVSIGTISGTLAERLERLSQLMERFSVNMCAIDSQPDGMFSEAFAKQFPGRVYRVSFFTPAAHGRVEPPMWNVNDGEQFCSLHRTKFYDATFERFRRQHVLLPPLESIDPVYPKHLGNLYRRRTELPGETGRERIDYVRTGDEDFAQCEAYCYAAIMLFRRQVGLSALNGTVALADQLDFEPLDLTSYGEAGSQVYRPGFS